MRRILPIFLIGLSSISFGQDKIEGIGMFKLKKATVAILVTLEKEQRLKFQTEIIDSFYSRFKLHL